MTIRHKDYTNVRSNIGPTQSVNKLTKVEKIYTWSDFVKWSLDTIVDYRCGIISESQVIEGYESMYYKMTTIVQIESLDWMLEAFDFTSDYVVDKIIEMDDRSSEPSPMERAKTYLGEGKISLRQAMRIVDESKYGDRGHVAAWIYRVYPIEQIDEWVKDKVMNHSSHSVCLNVSVLARAETHSSWWHEAVENSKDDVYKSWAAYMLFVNHHATIKWTRKMLEQCERNAMRDSYVMMLYNKKLVGKRWYNQMLQNNRDKGCDI